MPAKRPPTSEAQKEKLRAAQLRYVAESPKWALHRANLAAAQRKPEQRERLSHAMTSYMAQDPRWPAHEVRFRQAAAEVTRLTLSQEEIDQIAALRAKGRNFEYIAEVICVSERVLRRELRARDIPTGRLPPRRKAKRGKGYWRSFEDAHAVTL